MRPTEPLKIAIIAPPWLSLYPGCFYGIENVVHHLATSLTKLGHHVELFTISGSRSKVTKIHWYHKDEQYKHIHRPWYEVATISVSHLLYALNKIQEAGDFDIIHDNNSFMGPAVLAYADKKLPPILHTLHEPFTDERLVADGIPDNRLMFEQFKDINRMYFNTVSKKQLQSAPKQLQKRIKGVVYNGVDLSEYKYSTKKGDYCLTMARIQPAKGQAVAAKACYQLKEKLIMAGTIDGRINTPGQLKKALAKPDKSHQGEGGLIYFEKQISPFLVPGRIRYVGSVYGQRKLRLFSKAKAFLFPINWEEPFGMAMIDALASGTPVIAYRRGAVPEIIEHGVNGFIAENYREFKEYMKRVGEISPADCRRSVERKFSTKILAQNYVDLYRKIISESKSA